MNVEGNRTQVSLHIGNRDELLRLLKAQLYFWEDNALEMGESRVSNIQRIEEIDLTRTEKKWKELRITPIMTPIADDSLFSEVGMRYLSAYDVTSGGAITMEVEFLFSSTALECDYPSQIYSKAAAVAEILNRRMAKTSYQVKFSESEKNKRRRIHVEDEVTEVKLNADLGTRYAGKVSAIQFGGDEEEEASVYVDIEIPATMSVKFENRKERKISITDSRFNESLNACEVILCHLLNVIYKKLDIVPSREMQLDLTDWKTM